LLDRAIFLPYKAGGGQARFFRKLFDLGLGARSDERSPRTARRIARPGSRHLTLPVTIISGPESTGLACQALFSEGTSLEVAPREPFSRADAPS
jgi:hypothetical protein